MNPFHLFTTLRTNFTFYSWWGFRKRHIFLQYVVPIPIRRIVDDSSKQRQALRLCFLCVCLVQPPAYGHKHDPCKYLTANENAWHSWHKLATPDLWSHPSCALMHRWRWQTSVLKGTIHHDHSRNQTWHLWRSVYSSTDSTEKRKKEIDEERRGDKVS